MCLQWMPSIPMPELGILARTKILRSRCIRRGDQGLTMIPSRTLVASVQTLQPTILGGQERSLELDGKTNLTLDLAIL